MQDIAFFQFSTEEDFSYVLEFSGLDLSGRSLEIKVKDRASNTTRATLTNGSGVTISGSNVVEAAQSKASMVTWPRGEYSADVVDITGGAHSRIMAVRFVLDLPGRLVQGVQNRKAFVQWSPNQAVVTATGAIGPAGPAGAAATVAVGDTTTGAPGSFAAVTNSGTSGAAVLDFAIPRGDKGETGDAATIAVGDVTTVDPSVPATVTNSGTSGAAIFDFEIPKGETGPQGEPNTLTIGTVTTSLPASDAEATITGDAPNQTLNLVLPRGDQGPAGSVVDGDKGDVTVSGGGTVWTVDPRAITFAKTAAIATSRLLGRTTPGSGDIEVLTPSDARGILQITAQGETLILAGDAATQRSALGANANGSDIFTGATSLGKSLATAGDAAAARSDLGVPFEMIRAVTVSGSPATIDFTGSDFPSGYDTFMVVFDGVAPAVDDAYLALRVQTGGSTWQTSGYGYAGRVQGPGGGADTGTTIDGISGLIPVTRPAVGSGVGNAADEGANGTLFMNPADANARRRAYGHCVFTRSDGVDSEYHFGGCYGSAIVVTGLRLLWSSGAFANKGNVKLYGQRS